MPETAKGETRRSDRVGRKALLSLLLFPLLLVLIEGTFRALEPPLGIDQKKLVDLRHFLCTGQPRNFVPRAHTVFQRSEQHGRVNQLGFSDGPWSRQHRSGELRVLCLGGSTTEGGNILGIEGSYPYLLELELERRTGCPHEVMKAGISGWTTAEMLVSWFLTLRDFTPDVLVLHEGVNDLHARFQAGFRADYSHWRRPMPSDGEHGWRRWLTVSDAYLELRLALGGVPDIMTLTSVPRRFAGLTEEGFLPPETAAPFARNLACIARDARALGARVVLMTMPHQLAYDGSGAKLWHHGIEEFNELTRQLARDEGLELVDAARAFAERDAELAPAFLDLVHLSPVGNQVKAELLADTLLAPTTR